MSLQFGIGNMYTGPDHNESEFGCLQGVTLDFSYDKATLYCGAGLYPFDVRIHTSSISGKAQFAEVDAKAFYRLLGGESYTATDKKITIKDTTKPDAFRIRLVTTTDGVTMTVTLMQCRTDSLSFGMERTAYVIPDFGFSVFAGADHVIGTIDLGDAS
jgi:hypothetical protein